MEKEVYIYPAVFHLEEEGGYSVFLPDFGDVSTCGDDLAEALYMAKDLLFCEIDFMTQEKQQLPCPSALKDVKLDSDDDFVNLIEVNPKEYKKALSKSVKKSVTVPKDLNDEAEEFDINFSKVLRDALKVELEKIKVMK